MNESLFNFFYGFAHRTPALDFTIAYIAEWYGIVILLALFLYLFEHHDKPEKGVRDLIVVAITALSAWVIAIFFKDVFQTLRPFEALSQVTPLVLEGGYAFPSGHATFFMALAVSLWFYHKRLAVFFGLSAIIIGFARIAAGIHWPVDILGGLILGYVIGTTLHNLISDVVRGKMPK
ncbi:MAG: phosphatase PAP2 family protein [Candidatus Pacebacteria bacterium]|jgi:undecaprenyl-diphosphatase|nr:phosphatase PAP2 family protein [Candidatus Paceibacterota bacterium]